MHRLITIAYLLTFLVISSCFAQETANTAIPNLIRFGGTLKDAQGAALSSATVGITFAIYREQESGAPLWLETQNVTTDGSGNYSVLLGASTAKGLPNDLFSQQEQRWLGMQVEGQAEQARVLLVSVPYAFRAHEAETLGGKSVEDFVLAPRTSSSGSGEPSSAAESSSAPTTSQQGNKPGMKTPATNQGPTNFSGATSDQIVKVTQTGIGAGVSASAPTETIAGTATAASGKSVAVHGTATGPGGVALKGFATAATGSTIGISAYVASPAGTVALLNNGAGGKIISGQNNGVEKFSVDGNGNVNSSSGTYQIGAKRVLGIGASADQNVFLGVSAGASNMAGKGIDNTFTGYQAGYANTIGIYNTFNGTYAGSSNTSGVGNTFSGTSAGRANTTGGNNTFSGLNAGYSNTTGNWNTFNGGYTGFANSTGVNNTFTGYQAGYSTTEGGSNTFIGSQAGYSNMTGSHNILIGFNAGNQNIIGDNNIYIGSEGYSAGEFNTIRIGRNPPNNQGFVYIEGVYGEYVYQGLPVYINSDGQLGTHLLSRRLKEQITNMGESTNALMKLRPVTFVYRPEYQGGAHTLQYGLLAEEVAEIYPELVAYDKEGQPLEVRYEYLSTMLLNEVQKQYRRAESEAELNTAQQKKIEELEQRLSRLESASKLTVPSSVP